MLQWQGDVLESVGDPSLTVEGAFAELQKATQTLGFEYACYGIRVPMPHAAPEVLIFENYPKGWIQRYAARNYVRIDPSVKRAEQSLSPVLWQELAEEQPEFWEDARSHGLRHGWAQSTIDGTGAAGLLSLSRGTERISASELAAREAQLKWFASLSHVALFHRMRAALAARLVDKLTPREIEVFKWVAAGKTNDEIGDILNLSTDTVKFHVKNAIRKLGCVNKTQAAVRAALLGMLA